MPGTRYSATFDRTYVEEPPPPRNSPVRFSIQSWQGASLQNSLLNGSHRHHARSASTDSLDSSGTGASSSSGSSGTGHSRQVSMEGTGEPLITTRTVIKTPSNVSHNPLQFVKVGPVPLYKKATEQIKLVKEVKVNKEQVKEDEEQWQNNLDSWKNRRKKLSERAIQRVEDLKLLEQDNHGKQRKARTKTFSEIMEDRAQKPRGYNLSIYVENERQELEDLLSNNSSEYGKGDSSPASSNHSGDSSEQSNFLQTSVSVNNGKNHEPCDQEHVSHIAVNYECSVYSSKINNDNADIVLDRNSKESSVECAEEDCNGVCTIDSGLESFGSSQRVGDIQDTSSELSIDSSGGYDRTGNEDETDLGHSAENLLAADHKLPDSQPWPLNLEQKDGYIQLRILLWLRPELKAKDFGFSICEVKDGLCVDGVKSEGVAWRTGLRPLDIILAVNGENISGRAKKSVAFVITQSIYNGHLDLIVSRRENKDTKENEKNNRQDMYQQERCKESALPSHNAVSAVKRRLQNGRSFDDTWKEKKSHNDAFRSRSKSESSETWDEILDTVVKKPPPPIPVKPKTKQTFCDEAVGHAPIVRTISNEMKLERFSTHESMPSYLSPNGVTDISQEMQDAEDELDREMVVYDDSQLSMDSDELVFCVEQDLVISPPVVAGKSEKKLSTSSAVEEDIVRVELEPVETYFLAHESFEDVEQTAEIQPSKCEFLALTQEPVAFHQVKEENGLNIVFESHPIMTEPFHVQELPVQKSVSEKPSFEVDCAGHIDVALDLFQQQQQVSEDVLPSLVSEELKSVPQDEAPLNSDSGSRNELQDDSQESEWVREELSAICGERESLSLDSSFSQLGSSSSALHPDDQLLVDLDSQERLRLEPPKEKPPPPPPSDSPEQIPKMNTFKRVKKELWKRRSDFLGIDPGEDEISIDVPPPPDLSEILKSERDLERQNRLWLEKERFLSESSLQEPTSSAADSQDDEEIARREREIIINLELEEKASLALKDGDKEEDELSSTFDQDEQCSEEDARILRLQVERRRMEEERFQREEARIRMEEDRLFKEREEVLRKQEESTVEQEFQGPPKLNNPPPPQDSKPRILPKPNLLSRNLEKGRSEPIGEESGMEKEALLLERERLRREQERLQREKDDYRRQAELKQRRAFNLDSRGGAERQTTDRPKTVSCISSRDAVIFASKKPQGLSETSSEGSASEFNGMINGGEMESTVEPSLLPQQASRTAAHSLGAAPKARIIQNEQWINQPETVANKRHSDPSGSRGYNQNHWLVQEAEMRRITEQNERHQRQQQQLVAPESRRHSATVALRAGPQVQLPRHISSTAPRPYQRPAPPPPPPPKPPHGMPIQQTEQPWNYRPVSSVNMGPRGNNKEKVILGDLRKFRSESVLGVPAPWTGPSEAQPEHLLSVSGKERCSHCAEPLGRGGAMIIESLQLYYHMQCFCCCVCQAQLGNGTCGTDVRVRNHKLHCQNCYSNDEAGLKFSQV